MQDEEVEMITQELANGRVTVESADQVRTITINAPDTLNAVDDVMLWALGDAVLDRAGEERVIVLRGAGRGFCSGADLGAAEDLAEVAGGSTIDAANRLVRACVDSPLPIVAVVQGPCAGVGVPIALAADLVIASTAAFFQLAFSRIGLMPDGGASALVAASVGRATAARMTLLAERIGADEALALGLIAAAVPPEELDAKVAAVIRTLRTGPAVAFARGKSAVNAATLDPALDRAFSLEREGQVGLLAAADFAEGVAAFTEKRAPVFTDRP